MKILSKSEFFRMWKQGLLGNRTNQWYDPHEALAAGFPGYGFREHRAGGGTWIHVPRDRFWETYNEWKSAGRSFSMDEGCPDQYQTIQGEICRTFRGMEGFIGSSKLPMRPAIAQGLLKPRTYVETRILLDTFMDPSSRDDVDALFDLYPDATIEFTCFTIDVGVVPGRNTLFWEVRNY